MAVRCLKSEGFTVNRDASVWTVYVIELDPAVLEEKRFRERNPQHRPGVPCVYVGMTGLTVERMERLVRIYRDLRKKLLTKYSGDIV